MGTTDDVVPPWDAFPPDETAGHDDPEGPQRWDTPRGRSGRRQVLVALAVVPWAVVAAAFLLGGPAREPAPPTQTTASATVRADAATGEEAGDVADGSTAAAGQLPGGGAPGPTPAPAAVIVGGRVAAGAGEAAAVAVVVTRSWLGDVGPRLELRTGRAGTGAYVEHVAVESVDFPAPGAAVVTLLAVLLDVEGESYSTARVVRLAVPILLDDRGARPAGQPWWLPAPDLSPEPPAWTPVGDDPDLLAAAGAALEAAGYRDVDVRALRRSRGWPLEVVAVAVAPGASRPSEHSVWLREHLGDLIVAGWLPKRGGGTSAEAPGGAWPGNGRGAGSTADGRGAGSPDNGHGVGSPDNGHGAGSPDTDGRGVGSPDTDGRGAGSPTGRSR